MMLIVNQLIIRTEVQQCKRVEACIACQMHQGCRCQHIRQILGCMLETKKTILCYEFKSSLTWWSILNRQFIIHRIKKKKKRNIYSFYIYIYLFTVYSSLYDVESNYAIKSILLLKKMFSFSGFLFEKNPQKSG